MDPTQPSTNAPKPSSPLPEPIKGQPGLSNSTLQQSAPATTSATQPAATVFQDNSSASVSSQKSKKRRFGKMKLPLLIVLVVILLGGGVSAAYFGYIVPNQPDNIWKSALVNTGKGYDKLTDYVTNYQPSKGLKFSGDFKLTGTLAADGQFSGVSDGNNGQVKESFSMAGLKLDFEAITIAAKNSTYPDFYIKLNGLNGLGTLLGGAASSPELTKTLNGLNGQWYVIDHSLFDQLSSSSGLKVNQQPTRADLNDLLKTLGTTNKKFIFATDKNAVLNVKQNVGKETHDNHKAYHFKVGTNKTNLNTYLTELCNDVKNSKLVAKSTVSKGGASTGNQVILDQLFDCKSISVDSANKSDTVDVWVDMHTKLISAVRFIDKTNPANNYLDVVQNYQGGTSYPLGLVFHEKSKDAKSSTQGSLTMTLDTKTNTVKLNGSLNTTGSEKETGSLEATFEPNSSPVNVTKPSSAKTIIQLFNDLGLPNLFSSLNNTTFPPPVYLSPNSILQ